MGGDFHARIDNSRDQGLELVRARGQVFRLLAHRLPLLGAGRALGQLPFVLEQVLEEVVAPLGRRLAPGHFRAAGDGVGAETTVIVTSSLAIAEHVGEVAGT